MKKLILFVTALTAATASQAQLPGLRKRTGPPPAEAIAQGIDAQRAEFAAQSGGTTIFFGAESVGLGVPARTTLAAQAAWLRRHPEVVVRVEGYGDTTDTRDHAIAVGAQRADAVRAYLILMGVPAAQLSITSWGKERPGLGRAVTVLVR